MHAQKKFCACKHELLLNDNGGKTFELHESATSTKMSEIMLGEAPLPIDY